MTYDQRAVVEALVARAPEILATEFRVDSCIGSTKVGLQALRYFGVNAKPCSVRALAANPVATVALEAGAKTPDELPEGWWTVVVDVRSENDGRWGGHLTILLPDLRGLVDLTLGQFARPEHDLDVPPAASFSLTDRFLSGGEEGWRLDNGCSVAYGLHDTRTYTNTPGWRRPYNELTGRVIRAMKDDLGVAS